MTSPAKVDEAENDNPDDGSSKAKLHTLFYTMTLREKIKYVINTKEFHIVVVTLVIIDCILVITELLIDLDAFGVAVDESHEPGNSTDGHAKAEESGLTQAAHVLHYCSIAILSVFMIEIGVKIFAMGKEFLHHKIEIADALIVVISFCLDVVFFDEEDAVGAVGLLVVLRLWRVTRIVNGIILSVKSNAAKDVEKERSHRSVAESELSKFVEFCAAQGREIEILRALLVQNGVEIPNIDKPEIPKITVSSAAAANMYLSMPS